MAMRMYDVIEKKRDGRELSDKGLPDVGIFDGCLLERNDGCGGANTYHGDER